MNLKPGGYEDQAWYNQVTKNWDLLPEYLKPERPLTPEAKQLLVLEVIGNIRALQQLGIRPDKLSDYLPRPGYRLLGFAQWLAEKSSKAKIDAGEIIASLQGLWTTIFPFCAVPPPAG